MKIIANTATSRKSSVRFQSVKLEIFDTVQPVELWYWGRPML